MYSAEELQTIKLLKLQVQVSIFKVLVCLLKVLISFRLIEGLCRNYWAEVLSWLIILSSGKLRMYFERMLWLWLTFLLSVIVEKWIGVVKDIMTGLYVCFFVVVVVMTLFHSFFICKFL